MVNQKDLADEFGKLNKISEKTARFVSDNIPESQKGVVTTKTDEGEFVQAFKLLDIDPEKSIVIMENLNHVHAWELDPEKAFSSFELVANVASDVEMGEYIEEQIN